MKTKSLLFAALVSISLATTSCQKEENITPNVDYYSNNKNTDTTVIIDEKEAIMDGNEASQPISENTNTAKPKPNQPKSTLPTNIMQIDSDEVK
jgi:hypothetical protein